jgi:hypothetical protein
VKDCTNHRMTMPVPIELLSDRQGDTNFLHVVASMP